MTITGRRIRRFMGDSLLVGKNLVNVA